jgi:iron complex outermembrane receptor protein
MKTIYKKLLFLLLFLPFSVLAQGTLGGTVLDSKSNQPIPGVNVVIQGATNGTSTDFDGKFKLTKIKKGAKIVFSFIGYKNSVVTYDSQTSLTVSLVEESNQLQEVVVQVGYGSSKKKDLTGSVSLITAKDFNKGAIVSVDQLLTGKAAGVRITNDGGSPDSAPNIRIRGGASLNASNNPLIIIDGVPIGDNNPAGVSNPFTLINPNDVESFSILKDASATAIYGVRASNGVILITTKKGTTGEPQFNYSANISIGKVGKKLDVMDGPTFTKFIQQYFPGKTNLLGIDDPTTTAVDDPTTPQIEGRILSNTDWQSQIFRTAISTDHNFSARANLYKKIPFRASIGFANNQGLIKTSDYKRLSYSLKMTPKLLHDDLKIDVNAKGTYSDKNAIDEGGALGSALSMDPTKPVYDNSASNIFGGYYQETILNGGRNLTNGASNPLALLQQRQRPERVLRFLGNVEFDYKLPFLRDMRAVVNLGLDASQSRIRESFSNNSIATYTFNQGTDPATNYLFNPGLSYLENQTSTNKTMDAYLAYSKSFTGFVTKFDATGGYSYQDFRTDGYSLQFQNNLTTGIREPKIDVQNPNNRYYMPLNLQAYFARTNVDLLGRYLLTATIRADATSLFQKDKRVGYFPAVGAAWKMKEESFLKDVNSIQDLKLRLGWGKTGQSNITGAVGYFPSRPLFGIGNVNGQYLPGYTTYTALSFDPNITWEKTSTYNLGLDFEFFKNSILSGSLDVYQRKTSDLLATVPSPPGQGTGGTEFIKNVGSIEGKGVEFNMNVKVIRTDSFSLGLGGNIAYNYSTVKDLGGAQTVQDTGSGLNQTGVYLAQNHIGEQPYSAYVFEQVYAANGDPIVGAYVDRNGDGKIDNDDRYYKALRPNWTYGFNTNINYKNFDLTANFRGQIGGQVYNFKRLTNGNIQSAAPQNGTSINNVLNFYDGSANPLFYNYNGNAVFSDYLLEDATFLRCDNISLGYKFAKFVGKSSLRVSGSVNNVFIITKYSGQDPENFNAIDRNFYPRPTTYTFGVSLDF